ncbi:MAG: MOSC domain-containing protein [Gammaproteobacteria bacterium]|nr:MOSC domain-containing protein [Gammaproteobacteria bacterium]
MLFLDIDELEAGLPEILASPKDDGVVSMIVRRPDTNQREVLDSGELDVAEGLVGDNWRSRGSRMTADGSAHPDMQLNIMNARVISLVARSRERWALAGDQFFVDLDLSRENLPAGTRLAMGSAIIEVTAIPHTGCKKFTARFGLEAMKFVNSRRGKAHCLRGINAKVVQSGRVGVGDAIRKL